jgi:hypothetical protein
VFEKTMAAYKWKVHNGKIEIISLAVKFSVTEIKYMTALAMVQHSGLDVVPRARAHLHLDSTKLN